MPLAFLLTFFASALAGPAVDPLHGYTGTLPVTLELLRPSPDYPRLFVQAGLPGGHVGTFLVDTGADTSAITPEAAARWGVETEQDWGVVHGFSGTAVVSGASLPSLVFGDITVSHVTVMVDVPGLPAKADLMAIDGVLGNNVWSRFTLAIDYPSSALTLHEPGRTSPPRRAAPVKFDGQHLMTPIRVQTSPRNPDHETLLGWVDTGASGLTLCGAAGDGFEVPFTEGIEALRGIGTSETLPPHLYFQTTRRHPIHRAWFGGRRLRIVPDLVWIHYENPRTDDCAAGFQALIGHEFFTGQVLWIDYTQGYLWLEKSRKREEPENGHEVLYTQDLDLYGLEAPERSLYRAELLVGAQRLDDAEQLLQSMRSNPSVPPEHRVQAHIILSRILRLEGEFEASHDLLDLLDIDDLIDSAELVTYVHDRILHGDLARAEELTEQAVLSQPESSSPYVARAVLRQSQGLYEEAQFDWFQASQRVQFSEAFLLRRAQLAALSGDRAGAMAHMRKLLQLYPNIGHHLWFFALLSDTREDKEMARIDVERAMSQLHPDERPFDFLVAVHRILENPHSVQQALKRGLAHHCLPLDRGPARANCRAWYHALAGQHLRRSERQIRRTLKKDPRRSDYLDTLAQVMLAQGELTKARLASHQAVALDPGDPYLTWRLQHMSAQPPSP